MKYEIKELELGILRSYSTLGLYNGGTSSERLNEFLDTIAMKCFLDWNWNSILKMALEIAFKVHR